MFHKEYSLFFVKIAVDFSTNFAIFYVSNLAFMWYNVVVEEKEAF